MASSEIENRLTEIESNEREFLATIRQMEQTIVEQAKLCVELMDCFNLLMQTLVVLADQQSIAQSSDERTELKH